MKERMPLWWRKRIIPTMQEIQFQPCSPMLIWPWAHLSLASQQKCQSSSMKVVKARGTLWVQGGLTFTPRGYPLNITIWLTWRLSNFITSQYRNWKDVPRKDLIIVAFFPVLSYAFITVPARKRILERFFCWGIVTLLLQLCFDIDGSVQVSDSDLCRSQFPCPLFVCLH